MTVMSMGLQLADKGRLPDALLRIGIRRLCEKRLAELASRNGAWLDEFVEMMKQSPVAPVPEAANEQHYEVPAEFYGLCLGARRKYSGCLWPEGTRTLDEAETHALRETCQHARLEDGQRILELGCGWGSLTLWMAEQYPNAEITAVSNSASQRRFIEGVALARGFRNIRIITADMNDFQTGDRFDRVVSVEMFEHMRNYELLLERIASWLESDGLLFVHVFCHRETPYEFETQGESNWMGRNFFTGGIMPSERLLESFDRDLRVIDRWTWDGTHYQKTAEAWLKRLDANREQAISALAAVMPRREAIVQINRWRIFFMACAETFGYRGGREWPVSHCLLEKVEK